MFLGHDFLVNALATHLELSSIYTSHPKTCPRRPLSQFITAFLHRQFDPSCTAPDQPPPAASGIVTLSSSIRASFADGFPNPPEAFTRRILQYPSCVQIPTSKGSRFQSCTANQNSFDFPGPAATRSRSGAIFTAYSAGTENDQRGAAEGGRLSRS